LRVQDGSSGNTAAATLTVSAVGPPSISKAFAPSSIPLNGTTTLTFTIGNPNVTARSGIGFSDNMPAGLVVAATPNLANSCGGAVNGVTANSSSVSLANGSLTASGTCAMSLSVTRNATGTKNNVTTAVTSNEGGSGNTASATLTVSAVAPPSISKAFAPSSISVGGTTTLT